jgi:hypothetical protein
MELEGERGAIAFAFPDSSQAGEAAKIPRYARQIIEVVLR